MIPKTYALLATFCLICVTACTQLPTEKQSISDLRPSLSFSIVDQTYAGSIIFVDGLPMGSVDDYQEGKAALRVLPGTHLIQIRQHGKPAIEEKIYVGDGVNRTIRVN